MWNCSIGASLASLNLEEVDKLYFKPSTNSYSSYGRFASFSFHLITRTRPNISLNFSIKNSNSYSFGIRFLLIECILVSITLHIRDVKIHKTWAFQFVMETNLSHLAPSVLPTNMMNSCEKLMFMYWLENKSMQMINMRYLISNLNNLSKVGMHSVNSLNPMRSGHFP